MEDQVEFIDEAAEITKEQWDNIPTEKTKDTSSVETTGSILDYKKDKFKALFQARYILAKHGNMEERRMCKRQLDRMKKLGIHSV